MTTNHESLGRSSGRAPVAVQQRAPLVLLSSIAFFVGLVQPAAAALLVDGSSRSYLSYYDHANGDAYTLAQQVQNTPVDGQVATDVSLSANNYAKSSAGVGDNGWLTGKIAVGTNKSEFADGQILRAYSRSDYSEDWQIGNGACVADICPVVGVTLSLSQTGEFTLGAANFTVYYSLQTPSELISLYFNIHDESDPFGTSAWLARQNLGTGATILTDVDVDFTDLGGDRWSFAYSAEADFTTQLAFDEGLSLSGYANASSGTEYFDSYHSFNAALSTTDAGYVFTSASGRQIGTEEGGGTVPEPGSLYLLGAGLLGLAYRMKRAA